MSASARTERETASERGRAKAGKNWQRQRTEEPLGTQETPDSVFTPVYDTPAGTAASGSGQALSVSVPVEVRLHGQQPGDGKNCKAIGLVTGWKELSAHIEDGGSGNTQKSAAVRLTTPLPCCWRSNLSFGRIWSIFVCWRSHLEFQFSPSFPPSLLLTFLHIYRLERAGVKQPQPQVFIYLATHLPLDHTQRHTQAPLFQAAERLLWQWLS